MAHPRQVKLISESSRKDDRVDAEMLARLERVDPKLLRPIRHRGEAAQMDLMGIRARAGLVEARTSLVAKPAASGWRDAMPIRWEWRKRRSWRRGYRKYCGPCWSRWKR